MVLLDDRLIRVEEKIEPLGGGRSQGIAPIVDHPIGRNAVEHLPIPQREMQLLAVKIQTA